MNYFYYKRVLYYSLRSFCLDYNLSYDSFRYNLRKFPSKAEFYDYLNKHPEVLDVMIKRYSKNKGDK